jgi:hypothetical protein
MAKAKVDLIKIGREKMIVKIYNGTQVNSYVILPKDIDLVAFTKQTEAWDNFYEIELEEAKDDD